MVVSNEYYNYQFETIAFLKDIMNKCDNAILGFFISSPEPKAPGELIV